MFCKEILKAGNEIVISGIKLARTWKKQLSPNLIRALLKIVCLLEFGVQFVFQPISESACELNNLSSPRSPFKNVFLVFSMELLKKRVNLPNGKKHSKIVLIFYEQLTYRPHSDVTYFISLVFLKKLSLTESPTFSSKN